ncbi:hypothetical protein D9M70_521790 [compost metagenome]
MPGEPHPGVLPQGTQVFIDGERRLVATLGGLQFHRRHRDAVGLARGGIPPFVFDGRELQVAGFADHIGDRVFADAAIDAATAVAEGLHAGGLEVALEVLDLGERRRRQQHGLGALGLHRHPAGHAVAHPQGLVGALDVLADL